MEKSKIDFFINCEKTALLTNIVGSLRSTTRQQRKRRSKLQVFSIYSVIMSICLTFESKRNYPGTELRGAVTTLEKNIQICA